MLSILIWVYCVLMSMLFTETFSSFHFKSNHFITFNKITYDLSGNFCCYTSHLKKLSIVIG